LLEERALLRRGVGLVRCQLHRLPDPREVFLSSPTRCGALVFADRRAEHLHGVHGYTMPMDADAVSGCFGPVEPVEDRLDADQMDLILRDRPRRRRGASK